MSDEQVTAFQKISMGFLVCRITKAGRRYFYTGINDKGQTERWVLWRTPDDFVMKIYSERPTAMADMRMLRKSTNPGDRIVLACLEADPISVIANASKIKT
jgi:hypothetical protein